MKTSLEKRKLMSLRKKLSILATIGIVSNLSSVNLSDECYDSSSQNDMSVSDSFTKDIIDEMIDIKRQASIENSQSSLQEKSCILESIALIDKNMEMFDTLRDSRLIELNNVESYEKINNAIDTFENIDSRDVMVDSFEFFDEFYQSDSKESMIMEFSKIYYLDYDSVERLYNSNRKEIESSSNPKKTFIVMVKNLFYQTDIDKTPIISSKTREEKEAYIVHMAKDIYGVEDRELLALILAIHRLETGNSSSRRCIYDNNLGGVTDAHGFLTFKTFEIGAECFVRTVTNRVNEAYASPDYDYDLPIEYNIQEVYCDSSWGPQINPIKVSIMNSGELDKYFNDKKKTLN